MNQNITSGIIIGASISAAIIILLVQNSMNEHTEPIISQNDMYCATTFGFYLNEPIDHTALEIILRNKIAGLGATYDLPERNIEIKELKGNIIEITIGGIWHEESNLKDALSSIDAITKIEDFRLDRAWCY